MTTKSTEKKARGFAAMPKEKVSAISSKGGKAAHANGKAHQYTSETGRLHGAKGGKASAAKKKGKAPESDTLDPKRPVGVVCSGPSGCAGTFPADQAGSEIVSDPEGKMHKGSKVPTSADTQPMILDTDGDDLSKSPMGGDQGHCGSGGCGGG